MHLPLTLLAEARYRFPHGYVRAYRSKTLLSLRDSEPNGKGRQLLIDELALLDALVKVHLKNYQVWQHRRVIVVALDDASRELPFTTKALAYDSKNYHTWAYRQWALSHFYARVAAAPAVTTAAAEAHTKVWEDELEFTHHLLVTDVRNNSAWNHRWFTVFGRKEGASSETIDREIRWVEASAFDGPSLIYTEHAMRDTPAAPPRRYTQKKLELAPNNPSAWNYLRGILDRHSLPYAPFTQWARDLRSPADPTEDREGRVVLAVEFVADALAQQGNAADAVRAYEALKTLDAMRVNYWAQRQAMAEEVRVR